MLREHLHGLLHGPGGHEQLRKFDAIYFGAVGAPDVPDHITLWGLRLSICQPLDQYANVRPTRLLPGVAGPLREELGRQIDWVIVRENSEGEYAGVGGRAHRGLPIEVAMDVAVFTREGVARIFHEDELVLEAQQRAMSARPDRPFNNLNIDAGSLWARKLIDGLVAAETQGRPVIPLRPGRRKAMTQSRLTRCVRWMRRKRAGSRRSSRRSTRAAPA